MNQNKQTHHKQDDVENVETKYPDQARVRKILTILGDSLEKLEEMKGKSLLIDRMASEECNKIKQSISKITTKERILYAT